MRLSFGQEMRQVQKQILAPRMIQSMEILQLAVQALEERIEEEMQENPVLELRDEDPDLPEEQVEAEDPNAPTQEERVLVVDETKDNKDDFERLVNSDDEWLESFDERPRVSSQRVAEEGDRKHDAMANMEARPPSLQDHLREQLGWLEIDEVTRAMADRIIYNLDANGFLPGRLEDILDPNATRDELALAEKALAVVQKLDPLGVAARDLRECLLLQLNPKMDHYEELRVLIGDHLDDLMHNRLPQIQRRTGMSMDEIHDTIQELRKLKLRPAADFADAHVPNVTPDVYLEEGDNGEFKVFLQDGRTPSLCISPYYRKLLMQEGTSDAEKEWIKRKINSAQWLMDSIEQRRSTLTKISQAIVDHQVAFLRKGPEFIEPLKMQQIADKVGVHVTTVSRAVDDKWIQTPRGIFPLKRFFGGGTVSADGEEVAWDTVRLKLREIVDHEDKQNPYSDDDLVHELQKHGVPVARRTVTKYRKIMNIPSSRQRRDWSLGEGKPSEAHPAAESADEPDDSASESAEDSR